MLAAYNALEIDKTSDGTAMKRMMEIKSESLTMGNVQYYWPNDLVERVEFLDSKIVVSWRCGLQSSAALNIPNSEEPRHVAELCRGFKPHGGPRSTNYPSSDL